MKKIDRWFTIIVITAGLLLPLIPVLAHQPRLVTGGLTEVSDLEISKAYYAKLAGEPQVYRLSAPEAFDLYVNVLVPDIPGQKKNVSAVVIKDGDADNPIAVLDANASEWEGFWEPFGHDAYLVGPEFKTRAEAGEYEIRVSSPGNDSKYSLAIGEIEAFGLKETINTLSVIPEIKRDFFEKSPADFILSPIGAGYVIFMFLAAFMAGFVYRLILKRLAKGKPRGAGRNIGTPDRLIRFAIALVLFIIAITTSWSPILLFFSGFTLFEAIFSWCGLYAALGKNTCPI